VVMKLIKEECREKKEVEFMTMINNIPMIQRLRLWWLKGLGEKKGDRIGGTARSERSN
jgi:hypothetical protein